MNGFFYWGSDNFFFIYEIPLNIQVLELFKDNQVKSCRRMKIIDHLDLQLRRNKKEKKVWPLTPLDVVHASGCESELLYFIVFCKFDK